MGENKPFVPFVPADSTERELTLRAAALGILMAAVLGAANAYIGMKAGMTISAMFPAAVIAIAAFRLPFMRGGLLEQNISRTAASVGEALAAGAIFTIPAFVIIKSPDGTPLWENFNYWQTTFLILAGGALGVLLVIVLRRPICVEMDLPWPESVACCEIVKSGQKGASGAGYVFGAMGIGALLQFFKAEQGLLLIKESVSRFLYFPKSLLHHEGLNKINISHTGGIPFETPAASPALLGIGYVIGPRLAAINFSGSLLAWLVLIPIMLFLDPSLGGEKLQALNMDLAMSAWKDIVRPIAVGAMLVGAIYTLYQMRGTLISSIKGALKATSLKTDTSSDRTEIDLPLKWVLAGIIALVAPITILYWYFTKDFLSAVIAAVVMVVAAFLLSAIGGYLAGLIGLSNQPLSGLTLTTLIIAAVLMVSMGHTGKAGMVVVLSVTALVCCALSTSGDMLQDLKVGHLIGGTPWKMELVEIISVIIVSFVMVVPLIVLHKGYAASGGIGGSQLPAPQAGLMAQLVKGIVGGQMAWGLLLIGALLAVGLILINAPSPMLIAVGMYLPFSTTSAILVGGLMKWAVDTYLEKKNKSNEEKESINNKGILLASGFIAGEAILGIFLAAYAVAADKLNWKPSLTEAIFGTKELAFYTNYGAWLGLIVFAVVGYTLMYLPLKKSK